MPLVTKQFSASTFQEVFTRLDTLVLRVFEDCGSEGGAAFSVGFCARSFLSCRKLQWSPFEHCPLSLHW